MTARALDLPKVWQFLFESQRAGKACALVIVGRVEGTSMRNAGTLMGVCADGSFAGSLSGGCIEEAVIAEALDALSGRQRRVVRFGAGSPYLDIRLPCGGGLDLVFEPLSDSECARQCVDRIARRQTFALRLDKTGAHCLDGPHEPAFDPSSGELTFPYFPPPRLEIIGHGASVMALAHLARVAECAVRVITPDKAALAEARQSGFEAVHLERANQCELLQSDPCTAFVFLFHDHDWEVTLMARALAMEHFYLGAMGSRRAHEARSAALSAQGLGADEIASIKAPIGLFYSSRDPQTLALSALSQIMQIYQQTDFLAG